MSTPDYFRRLFAWDAWANREVFASLDRAAGPPPRALKLLGHVLNGERLWHSRLLQDKQRVPVWPEPTLGECEARLDELQRQWQDYLDDLSPEQLAQTIPYVNTEGQAWSNTIGDILTHVVLHSAYHRGQIARELRDAGQTPAYTDFIHAVRQGLVE